MSMFIQATINGVLLGALYGLFSVPISLIFGVMDIINFAHGEFLMLAMYSAFFSWAVLGIDPILSILIIAPIFFLFGIIIEKIVIKPILKCEIFMQIVVTLGLSIIFMNIAHVAFTPHMRTINVFYSHSAFILGDYRINIGKVITFFISLLSIGLLHLFLNKTKTGLAIRATVQDKEAAQAIGVDVQKIYTIVFGIGILMCGIAGPGLAALFYTTPSVGQSYGLLAFMIAVLGGLGNIYGAFLGGLFMGLLHVYVSTYWSTLIAPAVYFSLFIIVLALRGRDYFVIFKKKIVFE